MLCALCCSVLSLMGREKNTPLAACKICCNTLQHTTTLHTATHTTTLTTGCVRELLQHAATHCTLATHASTLTAGCLRELLHLKVENWLNCASLEIECIEPTRTWKRKRKCCCGLLHCVALCCTVLHCVALCCTMLHCVALWCTVLQRVAVCCSVLQCVAVCCSVLQCVAVCCSVLQCVLQCVSNMSSSDEEMETKVKIRFVLQCML